jgi:hypothetical protein
MDKPRQLRLLLEKPNIKKPSMLKRRSKFHRLQTRQTNANIDITKYSKVMNLKLLSQPQQQPNKTQTTTQHQKQPHIKPPKKSNTQKTHNNNQTKTQKTKTRKPKTACSIFCKFNRHSSIKQNRLSHIFLLTKLAAVA